MNVNTTNRAKWCADLMRICAAQKKYGVVAFGLDITIDEDLVPLPLAIVFLLSLFSSNANKAEISIIETTLRELYFPDLTREQCLAILRVSGRLEDLVTTGEQAAYIVVYADGTVYSMALGYTLRLLKGGWVIETSESCAGRPVKSLQSGHEYAAYMRSGTAIKEES